MKYNLGIVGHGIVGSAVEYGFQNENIFIYDKFKPTLSLEEVAKKSDIIFVCVPTPITEDYSGIDLSIVEENVDALAKLLKNTEKIIVLKSTIVPGTTAKFEKKYPKVKFAFNPEFLTEANYLEDFVKADRHIIGASDYDVSTKLMALYKSHFPNTPIYQTSPTAAEMAKYMANCYLATKVLFANEMFEICQNVGVYYPDVKNLVVTDHRIYNSHLDITPERGFGGKCFPKDMLALRGEAKKRRVETNLMDAVWNKNLKIRRIRDWEEIPFAVTKNKKSRQ